MLHGCSYLYVSLFWLAVSIVFLFTAGQHRKISVIIGIFYMVVLPLYIPFEKEYWSPDRVGCQILGIEDAILLFALGSIPWAVVGTVLRERLTTYFIWPTFLRRCAFLAVLGMGAFLLLWLSGWHPIPASIVAQILISILVLVLRKDLWPLAVIGFVALVPLYLVKLKIAYWLWPDFATAWNLGNFWGSTMWGLPIGEIAWVSSGAWGFPIGVGYTVSAKLGSGRVPNSADRESDRAHA